MTLIEGTALMLTQLSISGFALIESLAITFSPELNVITGETGAGKSIIIKALGLVMGQKASADLVRAGFDQAQVAAEFVLNDQHAAVAFLAGTGLLNRPPQGTGANGEVALIIRRSVSAKGRSSAWINDIPVTLTSLRDLGEHLLDIFGQHDNHRLLDASTHVTYLDKFLSDPAIVDQYRASFSDVMSGIGVLHDLVSTFEQKSRERDYLEFRLAEFEKLEPSLDDFAALESKCEQGNLQLKLRTDLVDVQRLLDEGAQGQPLSQILSQVSRKLNTLNNKNPDPVWGGLQELCMSIHEQLNDMSFEVGQRLSLCDVDERELEQARDRLFAYRDLMRKLGVDGVEGLVRAEEELRSEIVFIDQAAEQIEVELAKLEVQTEQLLDLAAKLSQQRKAAFNKINHLIQKELHALNMKGARLHIDSTPITQSLSPLQLSVFGDEICRRWQNLETKLSGVGRQGDEKIQFLLAANPGEPAKPLAKVASGGELSRIMLGIKKVLAMGALTCVMVFDEIDTGISGKTANVVGRKLRELAAYHQVICISHLAQVAAFAEAHFVIEKRQSKKRTESQIIRLSATQSAKEIARLLSGEEITDSSLKNAKALISRAKSESRESLRT